MVGRWTRRSAVSVSLKTFGNREMGYPGSFGKEKAWIGGFGAGHRWQASCVAGDGRRVEWVSRRGGVRWGLVSRMANATVEDSGDAAPA